MALLFFGAVLAGCAGDEQAPFTPPEVTVARPIEKPVTLFAEFTGTTEAMESVDVLARVEGFLEQVHFEDSADVEQGALLFEIEPDQFEARVKQGAAEMEAAQAELLFAESELKRMQQLVDRGVITQSELEIKTAHRDKAKAAVALSRAALDEAELNLSYTNVHAPIAGRVSRKLVDMGNLVGSNGNVLLTTIVQLDPIYAYFNISERVLVDTQRRNQQQNPEGIEERTIEAYMAIGNEKDFSYHGEIDFIDNRVNPDTGTIQVRARFANSKKLLQPGMFVRVRIPLQVHDAVVIEERALGTDLGGKFVLVVGEKNIVEHRPVQIGPLDGGMRVIEEGLSPGELYVVNGLLRARPGMPVTPQMQEAPAAGESLGDGSDQKVSATDGTTE